MPSPSPRTYARPVTHADAGLTLGAFLLATAAGGLLLVALVSLGVDPDAAATGVIPTTVALWFLAVWYSLRARGWTWADLGLSRERRTGRWLWQVPLAYLVVMTLTVLVGSLLMEPAEPSTMMAGGVRFGPAALVALWLSVVVVGPLVEELVFRRVLLGWLESRLGFVVALVGQAALFAVMHLIPQVMVMTFLLGLAAGLLARWHRSLWPALALHVLNNLIATTVLISLLA